MSRGTPQLVVRLSPKVHQGLREAAARRGLSVTQYTQPMLRYLATVDQDDLIWGELGPTMRFPRVEKVPIPRN